MKTYTERHMLPFCQVINKNNLRWMVRAIRREQESTLRVKNKLGWMVHVIRGEQESTLMILMKLKMQGKR